jgi:hypothetical protein
MLEAHRTIVQAHAGAGQTGIAYQAYYGPAIKALQAVVNADADPRLTNR